MTAALLRCTALPADIDGAAGIRQHGLTDALLDTFSSKLLWDEYGIDAEIIPFTRDFPRADIHELISLDLLHQAIKGTFKDHLVDWVGEYLEITYEKAEAERILDEIDRRYVYRLDIHFNSLPIPLYYQYLDWLRPPHFLSYESLSRGAGSSSGWGMTRRHS